MSGGMQGGVNDSVQNSFPVADAHGQPIGWTITVYDDGLTTCTINKYVGDGTVSTGNPPQFSIDGGYITGQAVAVCCRP